MWSLALLYCSWFIAAAIPRKNPKARISPPVSVIIPAHNEESNIEKTLESVAQSKYPGPIEMIVVNDGSTDGTVKKVENFSKRFKRLKMIRTHHVGKAEAVNSALKHARSEIVLVLDADTSIESDAIEQIVQPFSKKGVAAVASSIRAEMSGNPLTWFQQFEYSTYTAWRFVVEGVGGSCIVPGFCAFRKSALQKVGGMRGETAVEDYDICMYLKKAGYQIAMAHLSVARTKVPETVGDLVRQRLRWAQGTVQVIMRHKDMLFNKKFSAVGLYSMPTQIFGLVYSLVYLPIVGYQILSGYLNIVSQHAAFSGLLAYSLKWATSYGVFDFFYKMLTSVYATSQMNILVSAVFVLTIGFGVYSILKFSKFGLRPLLSMMVLFPYTVLIMSVYVYGALLQFLGRGSGGIWEKNG